MTTLRSAVQEYLTLRRSLGFKLHETGKGLLAFVTFMEAAPCRPYHDPVGAHLGSTTGERPTSALGSATELRPRIRSVSQRDGSPHADSGAGPTALPAEAGATPICTRRLRFGASCAPRSPCPAAMNAVPCGRGSSLSVRAAECLGAAPTT
jgi:hypothetical protein